MLTLMKGSTSPSITATVKTSGVAVDLTGCTVKFRTRLASSSTLKVDAAATVVSAVAGTVRYDWASIDVDTPGEYVAWWQVTFPSARTQDVPEGVLIITDHGPSALAELCSVADVKVAFSTPDTDDPLVQTLIVAASRAICERYSREFGPQTAGATRLYRIDNYVVNLNADDLRAATTITLDPNGTPRVLVAGTDYKLLPLGSSSLGTYTHIRLANNLTLSSTTTTNFGFAELQILGDWGAFTAQSVPSDIRRGCVETVGSWIDRAVSAYAASVSDDQSFGGLPNRFAGWGIPSSAHRLLAQYDRIVV